MLPQDPRAASSQGSVDARGRDTLDRESVSGAADTVSSQGSVDARRRGTFDRESMSEAAGDARADALPQQLGRYHVLGRLGSGGMGVVYSAYDPDLDRRVAVKLLRPDHRGRDSQIRLLREAQALARLSHPNVVQVYDTGALGEQVFIAMEFVRGVDLHTWLAGQRSVEEILRNFVAAGRGLAAAHDAGLVHRDFKPENVLVGEDGRVCVADFGLARDDGAVAVEGGSGVSRPLDLSLTVTGVLLGTPTYMSPEQHEGRVADARSDQFSFCVALWEALYGARPFAGDNHAALATAVRLGQIRDPPADARAPRRFAAVLRRGLAVDPAQRYPNMHALLAALAPASRRGRVVAGLALVGLVGGAGLAFADWRARVAEACSGGAVEVAAVWSDADHGAVQQVLAGGPDPELAGRVVAGLDTYAAAWAGAHREACLAHRRGEQSSGLLDARMRCLHGRRVALASAARLLSVRSESPPDAAQVVARLPSVAPCSDVGVVMAELPPPEDPAVAAAVAGVEERLAGARTLAYAGEFAAAEATAEAAVGEARALEYPPLLAASLLTLGAIEMDRPGGDAEAAEHLDEATAVGLAARHDAVAAESLARQVFVEVAGLGRTEVARSQVPLARALAQRLPDPAAALARAYHNEGVMHKAAADQPRALEAFTRAVAEADRATDVDPIERANYLASLASVTEDPQRREALLARNEAELTALLGPMHPRVLSRRLFRARWTRDLAAAREEVQAICAALRERTPEDIERHASCNYMLGHIEARLGRTEEAGAALEETRRFAAGLPAEHHNHLLARGAEALAAVLAGEHVKAVAAVDAGVAEFGRYGDLPWIAAELAELELTRGRALLALQRRDEAIAALQRAVAGLSAPHPGQGFTLTQLWLADARALLVEAGVAP
ncbi:serine/threonine-protein kinase [Nannocystis punicea]|uniref:Protein kinase n=1 Tax=Nannocystis punicea TaxID=2995304 RepID=A0ABY7GXT6_9BACT|nr:serine/threonine-protein kinase [Nannocystis poenicansa]WAS91771.1 protein kinase [Nannocystis poenicansa]